jgi:hypothetical protein
MLTKLNADVEKALCSLFSPLHSTPYLLVDESMCIADRNKVIHPTLKYIKLHIFYTYGLSKENFGVVQAINDEQATVVVYIKERDHCKCSKVIEHLIYHLTIC